MEKMILTRPGNKSTKAEAIQAFFPSFKMYAEPFFGAGGMFFNLHSKPKYAFLNDMDAEVFNLWQLMQSEPEKVHEAYSKLFNCQNTFNYFKKHVPECPYDRAARFLFLSNCSYLGTGTTFVIADKNSFDRFFLSYKATKEAIGSGYVCGLDAQKFIETISITDKKKTDTLFVYCDPPYIGTDDKYTTESWTAEKLRSLIEAMQKRGFLFAVSEYAGSEGESVGYDMGLNIETVKTVRSLANRNTEILMTSYKRGNTLF